MRAGELRHSVTVERATAAADRFGQPRETWAAVATHRAKVEAAAGPEAPTAGRVRAATRYRVTLRAGADIRPTDRLAWAGRILNVVGVADRAGRGIAIELDCVEVG